MPAAPPASSPRRLVEWNSLRTYLAWAYEGPPGSPTFDSPENALCIGWMLLRGSVRLHGPKSGRAQGVAGQWVFPAADKTTHEFSDDAHIVSLRFKAHWPNNTSLYNDERTIVFPASQFPRLLTVARQLVRIASTAMLTDNASPKMLSQPADLLLYLRLQRTLAVWLEVYADAMRRLGVPLTPSAKPDERAAIVQAAIDAIPIHREVDEVALARGVDLSVSQMNRLFVAGVGMTVRAYVDRRRLDAARNALLGDDASVKEIAYRLGFAQPSHFSAWFRKKMGVYPTDYRAMNVDTTRALG